MKRGFIYLINKETNKIVRTFNLITLKQDRELKQNIYNKFISKGTYTLICGCNHEIHMSIKSNYQLYHKRQADTENHDKYCPYSAFYKAHTSDPGWKEDEISGTTEATLDFSLKPHFYKETNKENHTSNQPTKSNNHGVGAPSSELTITALSKKLCMYSWNRLMDNKEVFPKDKYDYIRYIYGTSRLINCNGKRTTSNLQKIYYNHYKDRFYNDLSNKRIYNNDSCEPEGYRYVYAYLSKISISIDRYQDGIFNIECKIVIDNDVIDTFFSVHKKILSEAFASSGIFNHSLTQKHFLAVLEKGDLDQFNNKLIEKDIVVTGLVGKRKRENELEFYEIGFFEVNKYGLYSESSYEVDVYNYLCDNGILFYKPYTMIPEYDGYTPDFIIKNNSNKTIFGEVFGISNNLNHYDERKDIKRNLFKKELNDTHKLIDLDLTTNHKIPLKDRLDINAIRNFINNDTSENILTL